MKEAEIKIHLGEKIRDVSISGEANEVRALLVMLMNQNDHLKDLFKECVQATEDYQKDHPEAAKRMREDGSKNAHERFDTFTFGHN